jgi:hypothetical protein
MATPKTPRKRVEKSDNAEDVLQETPVSLAKNDSSDAEIVDAEVVLDAPVETVTETAMTENEPTLELGPKEGPPEAAADQDEATEVEPPPILEPAREIEALPPAPSGSRFFPLVLGGIVAAGIGFGLARFVVPEGWPMGNTAPIRVQMGENAAAIADVKSQVAALALSQTENPLAGDVGRIDESAAKALEVAEGAQAGLEALQQQLASFEAKLANLESRPVASSTVDSTVIDSLNTDMAAMRVEIAAQKATAEAAAADLAKAVDLARAEAEAKAQTLVLQAAAGQVKAALQSGAPYAEPLAQLAAAGLTTPAPLPDLAETGVPTIASLTIAFGDPARAALDASRRADTGQSVTERLGSFLQTQTGARSLTPQEGDDPDAVLSRIEAALRAADLPAALTLIAALPAPAQAEMADWVGQAQSRVAALEAVEMLSRALSER